MKQSPFKFQSNNSKKAKSPKNNAPLDHEDAGKQPLVPKKIKSVQPNAKSISHVRAARPVNAQRPQGKG